MQSDIGTVVGAYLIGFYQSDKCTRNFSRAKVIRPKPQTDDKSQAYLERLG